MSSLDLKMEFEALIRDALEGRLGLGYLGDCPLVPEYKFHKHRRWAFDFALPKYRVAFEYEGIFYLKGGSGKSRHLTPKGYTEDCEKYDWAALMGWKVIRITPIMVQKGIAGPLIRRAIEGIVKKTLFKEFQR